jgi:hypothetical protein
MKKLLILVFCSLLALLWGCAAPAAPSAAPEPTATPAPAQPSATAAPTAAPTAEPTPEPTAEPTPEYVPTPAPTVTPEPAEDLKAIAEGYIDSPVEDLYAAIGYPESADYAPSCLGDGEDGNLYYDGFTVYTYREDGEETVTYVE